MSFDLCDTLLLQIAFSNAKGISGATSLEMLERVGGLRAFFELSPAELHRITGIRSAIFFDEYRQSLIEEAKKETEFVRKNNIDTHFIGDDNYPDRLLNCEDAPVMLYTLGSCDLNSLHMVAIVGTRHATRYGIDFTRHIVAELSNRLDSLVIVSGLAYGIDVAAHISAIDNKVATAAVLGHGLSTIYPADHRSIAAKIASTGGALITEYTSSSRIHRSNFLERNRIVAGMCDCTIVVESDIRGGSMSTARIASDYNREVLALPGRVNDPYSRGTNKLINVGLASLITNADDIIERLGWEKETKQEKKDEAPQLFRALNVDEQSIIDMIRQYPEFTVNDICVRLGKPYSAVSGILFQLEIDDFITTLPGGRYAITIQ